MLALELALSHGRIGPGWWLEYPALYVAGSVAYGAVRWIASRRSWRRDAREPMRAKWLRRSFAAVVSLPVLALVLWQAGGGRYVWDGGYRVARYEFTVVDEDGHPLGGTLFSVLGPTRETWEYDWSQPATEKGLPPRLPGFWPIFEFDGNPLATGPDGRLVVNQMEQGIQFGGSGYTLFGMDFEASTDTPTHVLEFRHAGFRPRRLDFWSLDARAYRTDRSVLDGPSGCRVPCVEVQVVLERE